MAVELGTAYVSIIPSFRGGAAALSHQLAAPAAAAGTAAGKKAGTGLLGGFVPFAKRAGGALAGIFAGAALVNGIKNTVAAARALEKQTREVVTLFGESGKVADRSFGVIQKQVRSLSNQFGIAQETLVGGLYQAISAGVPRDNAFEFMQVASRAAIGGVTDVETAVDGLSTVVNAFGLEASDAERVSDSMFTTVKGGKTNFEQLSSSLFNVAPAAAAAGVEFTEINAALATLTASGTPTSVATTQLRAALVGLQRPSEDLDAIFQDLGFQNAELAIKSEGLGFALAAVKDATGGNNGELQKLLGSVEAVAAANVIAGTGADKFTSEMAAQADAAGATKKAFDEINKSRQLDLLKNSLRNVGITIAQATLPAINAAAAALARWLPGIIDTAKQVGQVLAPAFSILGALLSGVVVPAFRTVGKIIASNQAWLGPLAAGVAAVVVGFKAWTAATIAWAAVTKGAAAAQLALNVAMRANPIGLVITVVAALAAALIHAWKTSETFRRVVTRAWAAVRTVVVAAWGVLYRTVIQPWIRFHTLLWRAAATLRDTVTAAWRSLRERLAAVWSQIKSRTIDAVVAGFRRIMTWGRALRDGVGNAFASLRERLAALWGWIWRSAILPMINGFRRVPEVARAVRDGVGNAIAGMRERLAGLWRWIWNSSLAPLIRGFQRVWDKAVAIKDGVVNAFKSIVGGIKSALNTVFSWINTWMINPINRVLDKFGVPDIPDLKKLHSGGMVPGRGEKPYMLLGGEGVLNPEAMRRIGGKKTLDELNRGGNDITAMGGLGLPDWLTWDNARLGLAIGADLGAPGLTPFSEGGKLLSKGLLFALEKIVGAAKAGIGAVITDPWFVDKPTEKTVSIVGDETLAWARTNDKKARPGRIGGSVDASGAFAFPLPRGSYRVGGGLNSYPGHTGQDFPAATGTPVFAPFGGFLAQRSLTGSYGKHVNVLAGPLRFIAAHLSRFARVSGLVGKGDLIGYVGSTGNSTGPHLHAEFRDGGQVRDPRRFLTYDTGGYLPQGHSLVYNGTGGPERVLNRQETQNYERGIDPRQIADAVAQAMPRRFRFEAGGQVALATWVDEGQRIRDRRR